MARWLRLIASLALLNSWGAALATSTSAARGIVGANADLTALYDSVCDGRDEPGGEFRPVTSNEVPADLRDLYIGPGEGRYWRREGERPAFVVLTRGPGHWGGVEEFCIVGVHGATFDATLNTFSRRFHDRSMFRNNSVQTWERWGLVNVNVQDRRSHAAVMITQRPNGWVSLFMGGQVTATTTRWGSARREVNVDPR
jgi:hypothetical protein